MEIHKSNLNQRNYRLKWEVSHKFGDNEKRKKTHGPMSVAILCQVLEDARNISSCSSGKSMVRSQQTLLTEKVFRPTPTMSAQLCPYLCASIYVQVSPTILTCHGFANFELMIIS